MNLTVNGDPRQFDDGITVAALLALMQLEPARVAVERNHEVISRDQFATLELIDGDSLEIVQFVGGG